MSSWVPDGAKPVWLYHFEVYRRKTEADSWAETAREYGDYSNSLTVMETKVRKTPKGRFIVLYKAFASAILYNIGEDANE